ncbi:hypothetical protein ACP4OV_010796 [Aristida adscensionis]
MATTKAPSVPGPVPFKDFTGGAAVPVPAPPELEAEGTIAATSSTADDDDAGGTKKPWMRCYRATWVAARWVPGIVAIHRSFTPRRGDVVLASPPKCGTTWLKALTFATMARGAHPPAQAGHPLLRLNPHDCVPFMETLFAAGWGAGKMEALPSPRLMATHMQHSVLPSSIRDNNDCKIIYICREPKDMLVSLWHYVRKFKPDLSFNDLSEHACEGISLGGPIWDHVLGYWHASRASPEKVLFLRYEEMLRDPAGNVRKIAQFVGMPFSAAEEEAGTVMDIVRLCSFDKQRNLEVNRADPGVPFANDWYFRKAEVGDWANHMTPEMAQRLDAIVEEKIRGSGLSFK